MAKYMFCLATPHFWLVAATWHSRAGTDRPVGHSLAGVRTAAYLPDVELMVGKPDSAKDFFTRLLYLSTSQPQLKEGLT